MSLFFTSKIPESIKTNKVISEEMEEKLLAAVEDFKKDFVTGIS